VSTLPRWARVIQRRLLAQPEITESPRCDACGRLMAVRDMRPTGLCTDCTAERSRAFEMDDDGPFLPEDE
jgi:hypothetical protein